MAVAQIAVSPAAGPLTLNSDLLSKETITPPRIPDKIPEYTGAPEANEMPRQSGRATKKTVMLALKSYLRNDNK